MDEQDRDADLARRLQADEYDTKSPPAPAPAALQLVRTDSGALDSGVLPPLGEDRFLLLDPEPSDPTGHALVLRHGTSLALMAKASALINDEFKSDPSADWEDASKRRARLYFAVLEDPAAGTDSTEGLIVCALRAILEPPATIQLPDRAGSSQTTTRSRPMRLVIEYVHTREECAGRGYATRLARFVVEAARACGANVYVVALESAVLYWTQKALGPDGFVLEADEPLNKEINCFTDTFLLKLPTNAGDLATPGAGGEGEEEEEEEEEEAGDEEMDPETEDAELQSALAASLAPARGPAPAPAPAAQPARASAPARPRAPPAPSAATGLDDMALDEDLQRALAESMAQSRPK